MKDSGLLLRGREGVSSSLDLRALEYRGCSFIPQPFMKSYSVSCIPGLREWRIPRNLASGEGSDASSVMARLGDRQGL